MGPRRGSKRNRKVSDRMAVVDEEDRRNAQTARLDALEDGLDEDALAVGDDDDEFEVDDELDLDGKGKSKKRKSGSKRKMKVTGIPAASSFAVLLEESGVYEDKLPEPHYLSVETEAARVASARTFCQVCGNFSKYRCTRCREPYCSLKCYKTHNELRCLKFAL